MGLFCVISLSRSTCHRSFPSDSHTEGGLFGQLIWRGTSIHFLKSSLTSSTSLFFSFWCSEEAYVISQNGNARLQSEQGMSWADTQTKRGSWSCLGRNLSELDFVDGTVAGKPRLVLEILKTSVRNSKSQRFRNLLEYFYFPQASRDLCMFEAKQNSYLAMSKAIQLFQPSYVLALVIPQVHSSSAGCHATAIKTIPKLMELSVSWHIYIFLSYV